MSGSPINITNISTQYEFYPDYIRTTNLFAMFEWGNSGITSVATMVEYVEYITQYDTPAFADLYLDSEYPDHNTGASNFISVRVGATERKSLLRFELGNLNIPNFMRLIGARVKLNPTGSYDSDTYNLYWISNANADWIEGSQDGDTAQTGEPSWNNKKSSNSVPWAGSPGLSTAGVDYDTPVIATATTDTTENEPIYLEFNRRGLAVIRNEMAGKSNNNGFLMANENGQDNRNFNARGGNPEKEPKLELSFRLIDQPQRKLLLDVG